MADKKKITSLNVPKVERGVKEALTPGEKPEKQQTPIEKVLARELTEIVKEIDFDSKFESIKIAIESKHGETLLPILEKINNKLNPILGALYGISNINESTNMDTLLSKLGNLDPKLTMFSPINSVLESIYDILIEQIKSKSSGKSDDLAIAMSAELAKVFNYDFIIESINDNANSIIDIISEKNDDLIEAINKIVNINDFNLRTAQIIDAINAFMQNGKSDGKKELNSKVLQYDVNINASGLDANTVESLINLSKINVDSNEYIENLDKIVSGLSAFEALNKIKLDSKNVENIAKILSYFSDLNIEDFSKNAKKFDDLDKVIKSLLTSVTYLQKLASIPTKTIDISKNIKVLNDVAAYINDIDKVDKDKSIKNSESIKDCVKHFLWINMNLAIVAVSFPIAYLGALAMEKEVTILGKVIGKLNGEVATIDKNAENNLKALGLVIIAASGLLLLGALIGGFILGHLKEILAFIGTLDIFILTTIGVFNLATTGMKEAQLNANNFAKLLLISSGLMIFGALIGGFVLNNLTNILWFTATLSAFILLTIGALNLATTGMKEAQLNAKNFSNTILIAGGIMLLGAFLGGFILNNLESILVFTTALSAFILLTIGALNLATHGMKEAQLNANNFAKLLIISGSLMFLGGMIMLLHTPLILGAFAFSISLALFISLTIGAFNFASKGINSANFSANQFVILVGVAALSLMIGGFLFVQYPWMIATTLLFGVILNVFIRTIVEAYIFAEKHIKNTKAVAIGFGEIVLITAASMFLGGGLFLAFPGLDISCLIFAGVSALFITVFSIAIKRLSKISKVQLKNGTQAILGITGIIAALGGAFIVLGSAMQALSKINNPLMQLGIVFGVLTVITAIVVGLGFLLQIKSLDKVLKDGEKTLLIITGLIAVLGGAFIVFGSAMQALSQIENPLMQLVIIFGVLAVITAIVVGLGFLLQIKTMQRVLVQGAIVVAGITLLITLLGMSFIVLGSAMLALSKIENPWKQIGIILGVLAIITGLVIGIGALLMIPILWVVLGSGMAVIAGIELLIIGLSLAMSSIAKSVDDLEKIKNFKASTVIGAITQYFSIVPTILTLSNPLIVAGMLAATTSILAMSTAIKHIATAVKYACDLKTVDGKALTPADFDLAASNVKTVVTILGNALIEVYESNKEMFSAGTLGNLIGMDTPFARVSKSCSTLSKLITKISEGVKDFADLRMPIYDKNGNVTGYKSMTVNDFENAANSVKAVITCLGGALLDIYNEEPDMFNWQLIGDNPFVSVLKSCAKLGKLITDISAGVKDFADLRMPIFNEKGQKTGERTMNQADFENAANSVKAVITCLGGALIETYNENPDMFNWQLIGDNPFVSVLKSCSKLGKLITDISAGVKDFADLRMPIFDENGQKTGERTMGQADFENAANSVKAVITCLGGALIETYNENPDMFNWQLIGDNPFVSVLKSCSKLGKLITDISAGVKDFADLRMPIFDEKGQKIGERTMNQADFENAANSVKAVITCLGGALIETYNNNPEMFDSGFLKDSPFVKVAKSCGKLSELITDISAGVKDFADLRMPIFDENGQKIGERSMSQIDFENAAESVKSVIMCLGGALIETYNNNPEMFDGGFLKDSPFTKVSKSCSTLGELISNISNGVKSFADLRMPIYDENGQIVGERQMTAEDFTNASESVKSVITCLGNALLEVYDENPEMFSAGTIGDLIGSDTPFARVSESCGTLGELISNISNGVKSFADLRMPIYDENGQIVGERQMTAEDFINAAESVKSVVTCLGNALVEVYSENPEMFSAGTIGDLLGADTPFARVSKGCATLGDVVSKISAGVKDFAKLQIPIYKNGKIVDHRPLNNRDFINAARSVQTVVTWLGDALIDVYEKNPEMFSAGTIGDLLGEDTPFAIVANSCSTLGELVANISEGIKSFADLRVPMYNGQGKIVGYRSMKYSDFKNASFYIGLVVTHLANSLIGVYNTKPWLFLTGSEDTIFSKVVKSCSGIGNIVTGISDAIQDFADLRMPIYDKNGQITGHKPISPESFNKAKERIADVILCLAEAIYATYDANKTIFEDKGWFLKSATNTPASFVIKSMEGAGALVESGANAIKTVQDMELNFEELEGTNGSDGKVGKIVSILAKSIKSAYDLNPDLYKDEFFWMHDNNVKTPFGAVSACLNGVIPVIKSAADGVNYVAQMPYTSSELSENGELYNKVKGVVKAIPEAIFGITENENYGKDLQRLTNIDTFDTVNKIFGKFKNIIENAKNAYATVLSIDLKYSTLDAANANLGNMVTTLAYTIISEYNKHKELYQSNLSILYMSTTFKSYEELIKQVAKVYTLSINSLKNIDVSSKDNSTIETITNNLNTMINKLASSISINNASLDTNKVNIFKGNITTFSSSINELVMACSSIPTDLYKCNDVIRTIEELNSKIYNINNAEVFEKEQTGLDKYIKTLNSLDLDKAKAFSNLINAMNELASKLGSLDNFTSALNEKISATLSNLAQQIKVSGDIIKKADSLQKKRHEAITKSIKEIQSIMDKKLIVEVNHKEIQDNTGDFETPQLTGGPTPEMNMFGGTTLWGQTTNQFGGNNNYSQNSGVIDYIRLKDIIRQAIDESADIDNIINKMKKD